MLQNNQDSIVLSKSSSQEDLKRYFTAVLELSKSDNKFPINLDEVWPIVEVICSTIGSIAFFALLCIVGTLEKGGAL